LLKIATAFMEKLMNTPELVRSYFKSRQSMYAAADVL
jgi:hypothetical protein